MLGDVGAGLRDVKIELRERYVFKMGGEKTVNSLVTMKMRDGMIQYCEKEWDH